MLTTRQIFDKAKSHLLTQRAKAVNEDGECAYLTNNGLQCAVGCLIERREYRKEMEGLTFDELDQVRMAFKNFDLGNREHYALLGRLQHIHDLYQVDVWEDKLNKLENDFFGNVIRS